MIEVLIPRKLELPANTRLIFFSTEDREFADELLRPLNVGWQCELAQNVGYHAHARHMANVKRFLERLIAGSTMAR